MADIELNAIETKLAAARTRLILDKPFLGALVLRLPLKAADPQWCPTTGTDAKYLYYNPEYIHSLTLAQTQFMLAHEALHCALSHFSRRQHRQLHRWNLACDYAINPLLVEEGLSPPYDAQILDEYKGMTAEEIYPLLQEDERHETLDEHFYDQDSNSHSDGEQTRQEKAPPPPKDQSHKQDPPPKTQAAKQPNPQDGDAPPPRQNDEQRSHSDEPNHPLPLTPEEKNTLEVQWQQRLAGAAQQAMQAGKMSGALARLIDHLLQPRLPWRVLLAHYMTRAARDDYSYMRPSRRAQNNAILPSLHSAQVDVVVAVDTSGSISDREIQEFLSEVSALKGQMRARITLLPCDQALADGAPFVFEPWESVQLQAKMQGGGGTDFRPVFDWIAQQPQQPEILVYFSDLQGTFPELAPNYPVLWLVKGKAHPPWGQRIQLN